MTEEAELIAAQESRFQAPASSVCVHRTRNCWRHQPVSIDGEVMMPDGAWCWSVMGGVAIPREH